MSADLAAFNTWCTKELCPCSLAFSEVKEREDEGPVNVKTRLDGLQGPQSTYGDDVDLNAAQVLEQSRASNEDFLTPPEHHYGLDTYTETPSFDTAQDLHFFTGFPWASHDDQPMPQSQLWSIQEPNPQSGGLADDVGIPQDSLCPGFESYVLGLKSRDSSMRIGQTELAREHVFENESVPAGLQEQEPCFNTRNSQKGKRSRRSRKRDSLLKEQNCLLREQNSLLRKQNRLLRERNSHEKKRSSHSKKRNSLLKELNGLLRERRQSKESVSDGRLGGTQLAREAPLLAGGEESLDDISDDSLSGYADRSALKEQLDRP
ncbi:hypothetical protein Landi51_13648 [Colletotrichum acutatum]